MTFTSPQRPTETQARPPSEPRDVIKNIWHRARTNAYAHKFAAEHYSKFGRRYFIAGLICSILSILCVILVYLLNSNDGQAAKYLASGGIDSGILALIFVLSSIVLALASIICEVIGNSEKYDIYAAEHRFLNNSYLYIAQRAREANWPDMPYSDVVELLKDLERDFQLLKVRGRDPEDRFFRNAIDLLLEIKNNENMHKSQSFGPPEDP
ncbi:MAG: DUF4064 domain-containing protein [Thermodesulfobacteriota bacterium]